MIFFSLISEVLSYCNTQTIFTKFLQNTQLSSLITRLYLSIFCSQLRKESWYVSSAQQANNWNLFTDNICLIVDVIITYCAMQCSILINNKATIITNEFLKDFRDICYWLWLIYNVILCCGYWICSRTAPIILIVCSQANNSTMLMILFTQLMVSLQFLHLYIYISTSTTILEKDFNLVNNKTRQRMIVINCNGLASYGYYVGMFHHVMFIMLYGSIEVEQKDCSNA